MRRGLPSISGALLGGAAGLSALALFFGDGSRYPPLVWIGGLAVLGAGVGLALAFWPRVALPRLDGFGIAFLGLFVALVVWIGLSIAWSVAPSRSWEYFNRGAVYLAFAVLGVLVGAAPRAAWRVAAGGTVLSAAVVAWSLAGKVIPDLFPDGERVARLRDPLGYWNALALVAAIAVLLGVWVASRVELDRRLRAAACVLVFAATVTALLTYSRGGAVVAAVVVAGFVVLVPERMQALVAAAVGGLPGMVVALWAFTQEGIADDGQSYDTRLSDGLQLGGVLLVVGALVYASSLWLMRRESRYETWRWRPDRRQAVIGAGAAAVVVVVAILVASGGDPAAWAARARDEFTNPTATSAGNTPGRVGSLSSNTRWEWWQESWDVFEREPVAGQGAGAFDIARRPVRRNAIIVIEPHSVPIQLAAEMGMVGILLFLGLCVTGVLASAAAVRRLSGAERVAATALGLTALAYLLHALVDYDWDFLALTGPVSLIVGVLFAAGRPPVRAVRRPLAAAASVLVSLGLALSLFAPWYADRKVKAAYAAVFDGDFAQARDDATGARAWNPLSAEPLFASAVVAERTGERQEALDRYVEAVELQPKNWRTWYELARYEFELGMFETALRHSTASQALDPVNPRIGSLSIVIANRLSSE